MCIPITKSIIIQKFIETTIIIVEMYSIYYIYIGHSFFLTLYNNCFITIKTYNHYNNYYYRVIIKIS